MPKGLLGNVAIALLNITLDWGGAPTGGDSGIEKKSAPVTTNTVSGSVSVVGSIGSCSIAANGERHASVKPIAIQRRGHQMTISIGGSSAKATKQENSLSVKLPHEKCDDKQILIENIYFHNAD
jgi:hypothetical protein